MEACGEAAKTLKSYQLVGINFLMMLHKSESVGERARPLGEGGLPLLVVALCGACLCLVSVTSFIF